MIRGANKIVDTLLIKKKQEQKNDPNSKYVFILNIMIIIGIILAFVMYELVLYDVGSFKTDFLWLPLLCIVLIIVGSFAVVILGLLKNKKQYNLEQELQKELKNYLVKQLSFKQRGFLMTLGERFTYIMLEKKF